MDITELRVLIFHLNSDFKNSFSGVKIWMDIAKIDNLLSSIPSPHTRKNYNAGNEKFEKYFGNEIEPIIGSDDVGKTIDKWVVGK